MSRQWFTEILELLEPHELSGTTDVDIDKAVYTAFVELLRITPYTGGALRNVCVDLDFNKATTGWDAVSTGSDTLDVAVFAKIDGTNYRHLMSATQLVAVGNGTHATAGVRFQIGEVYGPISIRVKIDTERSDFEVPYRITYEGKRTPAITEVAA